jgi:hypothetical protein
MQMLLTRLDKQFDRPMAEEETCRGWIQIVGKRFGNY